jgi:signal transduction histidine kinase
MATTWRWLRLDSLTLRVVAFSTVLAMIALVVVGTLLSTFFRQATEQSFESLLSAHLFNLVGAVGVSEAGFLQGTPNLGDIRFTIANSGWYWSVEPITDQLSGSLQSPSMIEDIPVAPVAEMPFDRDYQRRYVMEGPAGDLIQVLETEFVLDEDDRVARFRVMGNRSELEEDIGFFDRQLYTYLAIFGLGMIAINAAAIVIALQPLRRVSSALADIRAGTARSLDGRFPAEIAPLASETNALIESNRRIIERSRTQVGNLAHSLKTPLAVLMNEGRALGGAKGRLIGEQSAAMQQQIEHYLQRARIAAQRDSVVFRTQLNETLTRMLRVMAKLNPSIRLEASIAEDELVFAGEREDFEELAGNLLENAFKWAASRVSVRLEPELSGGSRTIRFTIEDDGPGIPEEQAREALRRGRRLDETKPGTGLGLSIVADLVKEYGGTLHLERATIGGLRVVVVLPRAE